MMVKPSNGSQAKGKDKWDKISIGVDLAHKCLILIIGSIVAAAFYSFQVLDTQRRSAVELMSQRESSDSSLRAQMFNTLFQAYFKDMASDQANPDVKSTRAVANSSNAHAEKLSVPDKLDVLKRESMFSDLLSRNFEDMDVRPLLEDLDTQLTTYIGYRSAPGASNSLEDAAIHTKAFALRESLRRAAYGATSRQAMSLVGGAKADAASVKVTQCKGGAPDPALPFPDWLIQVVNLRDGKVSVAILPEINPSESSGAAKHVAPSYIEITFYDMPSLENSIMPTGQRVAFMLTEYVSFEACTKYMDEIEPVIQPQCITLLANKEQCDEAFIRAVVLPDGYIAPRDRPYKIAAIEERVSSLASTLKNFIKGN